MERSKTPVSTCPTDRVVLGLSFPICQLRHPTLLQQLSEPCLPSPSGLGTVPPPCECASKPKHTTLPLFSHNITKLSFRLGSGAVLSVQRSLPNLSPSSNTGTSHAPTSPQSAKVLLNGASNPLKYA